MSASNKGELKFLKKEQIKEKSYRPVDDIVTDSIHFGDVRFISDIYMFIP